jgi:hypothetical protein
MRSSISRCHRFFVLSCHSERSEESAVYDGNARSLAKKTQETARLSSEPAAVLPVRFMDVTPINPCA